MKSLLWTAASIALVVVLSGCNTWYGVKQDAKEVGQAAGKGIEKAGEKIQDVAR